MYVGYWYHNRGSGWPEGCTWSGGEEGGSALDIEVTPPLPQSTSPSLAWLARATLTALLTDWAYERFNIFLTQIWELICTVSTYCIVKTFSFQNDSLQKSIKLVLVHLRYLSRKTTKQIRSKYCLYYTIYHKKGGWYSLLVIRLTLALKFS